MMLPPSITAQILAHAKEESPKNVVVWLLLLRGSVVISLARTWPIRLMSILC